MTLERWCHDVELLVTHLQGKGNDKAEKQARWCNGNEMKTKAKRVGDTGPFPFVVTYSYTTYRCLQK